MAVVLAIAILWPMHAFAQRGQDAGLVGTVRDASGGVLAGATVTVSSPELIGGAQASTTDPQGAYRFPFLPPGQYEIIVEHTRFTRTQRSDVRLLPGLTLTVDFSLDVTAVNETVLVTGAAPLVDVRTSASPTLIGRRLIENLPLSRPVSDSVNLAPGVIRGVAFGGSFLSNPFSLETPLLANFTYRTR